MNIIITSHAKQEYGENLVVLGQTFDAYKKMDYLFDLMLEIKLVDKGDNVYSLATVKKTRIARFPYMQSFKFSYQEVADRYGHEIMEKKADMIALATDDQVCEIYALQRELNVSRETLDRWLFKAGVDSFDLMPKETLQKCIDYLYVKKGQQYEIDAINDANSLSQLQEGIDE